jgi:hypothetical protein
MVERVFNIMLNKWQSTTTELNINRKDTGTEGGGDFM